jgi:hypothetical protein
MGIGGVNINGSLDAKPGSMVGTSAPPIEHR